MFGLGAAELEAVRLSLKVAVWATVLALPVAFFLAYALTRWRFPGRGALNVLVHLPLVMPPVVTGYLLLLAFGRRGPIGEWLESLFGFVLAFRWTGAVLAAALMGLPLVVRAMRLALEAVDPKLEAAAGTLGAGPLRVFFTITLPLALPGVLSGAVLGFAKAMGEFGATITFVSNIPGETQTIPLAVNTLLEVPGAEPLALRLAVVSILISAVAIWLSERLASRLHSRRQA
ncbi:molybdate ABC transporter permease subunit [Pelagovum sp. HNIBRBA483]|uniref:molybdate ABC transporter permease subunit n=1 Tax=Pelagovum sp. HNIBRBA483 TaxID=3233341 RepID=UPI0034A39BA3